MDLEAKIREILDLVNGDGATVARVDGLVRALVNAALEEVAVGCLEAEPQSGLAGWIRNDLMLPPKT